MKALKDKFDFERVFRTESWSIDTFLKILF